MRFGRVGCGKQGKTKVGNKNGEKSNLKFGQVQTRLTGEFCRDLKPRSQLTKI